MPLYEYICKTCSESFCLLQKVGSSVKDCSCPKCGSKDIVKKVSAFSCGCEGDSVSSSFSMPRFSGGG